MKMMSSSPQTKTVFLIAGMILLAGSILGSVGCNTIPKEDSATITERPAGLSTPEAKPAAGAAGGGTVAPANPGSSLTR
ncbi:MAG: hypothetical protein H8F28_02955 [Fibrella sp.]|nr:hypothetical protein [Armatimonadota bacterium]